MAATAGGSWILKEPLKVLDCGDHPYLETALGTLGRHEVAVHLSPGDPEHFVPGEFRIFLDGVEIYETGDAAPGRTWFQLCQELGYRPDLHWDWDPALLLFQQVIPALTRDWHELDLPYTEAGVPEGVICLGNLRRAWAERVALLPLGREEGPKRLAAELFRRLPLRAVVLHDDPERRVDYVGNPLDAPFLGEFLHFGVQRETAVTLSRMTLSSTGGMKWSPWLPGGAWSTEGRALAATQGAAHFLRAAGLPGEVPRGFEEAFRALLEQLCAHLQPFVEAYRESWPAGFAWHRDPKNRYVGRTIVETRLGDETILVLDDGSEVVVAEQREPVPVPKPGQAQEVWGA